MSPSKRHIDVKQCIPHRQFCGGVVVYLQLARRPPDALLEILRNHGYFRRGPAGAGWHLALADLQSLIRELRDFPSVQRAVRSCLTNLQQMSLEDIPCPSRETQQQPFSQQRKKSNITVVKRK